MPRYFFDLNEDGKVTRDGFGEEFDDIEDARALCQSMLPDIVREKLPDGDLHVVTCDVRDEAGKVVYRGRVTYEGTRNPG